MCIIRFFIEPEIPHNIQIIQKLLRTPYSYPNITLAQLLQRSVPLLLEHLIELLLFGLRLEPLPGQHRLQQVNEHEPQGLQVVFPGLLVPRMRAQGGVATGASHPKFLLVASNIREVTICAHLCGKSA